MHEKETISLGRDEYMGNERIDDTFTHRVYCRHWLYKIVLSPLLIHLFNNELYAGVFTGILMAFVLIGSTYIIALRPKSLSWMELGVTPFNKGAWKMILLSTLTVIIGVIIITIVTSLLGGTWENEKTDALEQHISDSSFLIAFISAAIISPIYEEVFYRGFLFRWFRTRTNFITASLCSSIIFSIAHIPTYNVVPVACFTGFVFAYVYEKTDSIWPSVFVHGLSNGIMLLLTIS